MGVNKMLHLFCPDFCCTRITDISVEWLKAHAVKTIILDVDNTLLPWDSNVPKAENVEWIERLKSAGFRLILLSNNGGKRLEEICLTVDLPAVSWAAKPLSLGFRRALHRLKLKERREVLVIGDQIITDVLGAKQFGLKVLLVESLSQKEFIVTRLTRKIERAVIKKLTHKGLMPEGGEK